MNMNHYTITDSCIGCTICAKNCPVKAISGQLKEKHYIDIDKCICCGLCGKLCPKQAIVDNNGNIVKNQKKDDWKIPYIKSDCTGCSICVELCPKNCLEITKPKFHGDINTVAHLINVDDCIGCGICESNCPIAAIELRKR